MAAPTNLLSKFSRAICAYLVSWGINEKQVYPQFTGKVRDFSNGPIVTPIIGLGDPDPKFTGNRRFDISVSIEGTMASDGTDAGKEQQRVAFDAMVGEVYEALMQTDETDGQTLAATRDAINAAGNALATADPDPAVEAAKQPWRQAANNADMADFSVMQWVDSTWGRGEAQDCDWQMVLKFTAAAAETVGLTS